MTLITMGQAEKIVPVSRATLRRHAKEGKFTTSTNARGFQTVDVAELQRVYSELNTGHLETPQDTPETPERRHETPQDTALVQVETPQDTLEIVDLLKSQLEEARKREHHLLTALHSAQRCLQSEQQKTERLMIPPADKETPPEASGWRNWRQKLRFTTLV